MIKYYSEAPGYAQLKGRATPKIYEKGYAQTVTSLTGNSLQGCYAKSMVIV